jgi:hypothetical protein
MKVALQLQCGNTAKVRLVPEGDVSCFGGPESGLMVARSKVLKVLDNLFRWYSVLQHLPNLVR